MSPRPEEDRRQGATDKSANGYPVKQTKRGREGEKDCSLYSTPHDLVQTLSDAASCLEPWMLDSSLLQAG